MGERSGLGREVICVPSLPKEWRYIPTIPNEWRRKVQERFGYLICLTPDGRAYFMGYGFQKEHVPEHEDKKPKWFQDYENEARVWRSNIESQIEILMIPYRKSLKIISFAGLGIMGAILAEVVHQIIQFMGRHVK